MEDWHDILAAKLDQLGGAPEPEDDNTADSTEDTPRQKGKLRIDIERKGRAGKTATIISGFSLDDKTLRETASQLQRSIGCGGSARGGEILLQGDRRQAATTWLKSQGYKI